MWTFRGNLRPIRKSKNYLYTVLALCQYHIIDMNSNRQSIGEYFTFPTNTEYCVVFCKSFWCTRIRQTDQIICNFIILTPVLFVLKVKSMQDSFFVCDIFHVHVCLWWESEREGKKTVDAYEPRKGHRVFSKTQMLSQTTVRVSLV